MSNATIYQRITERVVDMLQNGIIPWKRNYNCGSQEHAFAWSHSTGEDYSLLNCMMLEKPGEYWTFDQAKKAGLKVRKGAKAQHVYFWKIIDYRSENEDGETTGGVVPYLRQYPVFHESDIEGAPKREEEYVDKTRNSDPIEDAENIMNKYFAMEAAPVLELKDCVPCYSPAKDKVSVPDRYRFESREDFYATIFHEMVHSTGHKKRLNRIAGGRFGSQSYAKEELVAEMGAARLSQICGFDGKVDENNAAYCANWIHRLENNIDWFVWASSRAEAAVNYITCKESRKA